MLVEDCVFCRILRGEIPSDKVYEDDKMLVFRDIEPKAKVHLLAIAKEHFAFLSDADERERELVSHILFKIPEKFPLLDNMAISLSENFSFGRR